jgi:hypothetical protein
LAPIEASPAGGIIMVYLIIIGNYCLSDFLISFLISYRKMRILGLLFLAIIGIVSSKK